MMPGGCSTEGPGLAPGSFGTRVPGADLAGVVPDDQGAGVFEPGGPGLSITSVTFYNNASAPPVGGGGRAASQIISKG
jgi:hypothetical protein